MLAKRDTVPDVQSCRNLCDRTRGCKAFNFVGNDCTLLSSVTGYSYAPGAVSGTVYGQGEAPPTPIDTSPVCPGSAGKTFTDGMNVTYDIVCYTQYDGSYIPVAPFNSNNLANCLPTCDQNELCAGVVYDTTSRQCRFLSAFDGAQRGNNNFIAAIRVGGPPAYSSSASSSVPPATVTTTLSPSTIICKLILLLVFLAGRQLTLPSISFRCNHHHYRPAYQHGNQHHRSHGSHRRILHKRLERHIQRLVLRLHLIFRLVRRKCSWRKRRRCNPLLHLRPHTRCHQSRRYLNRPPYLCNPFNHSWHLQSNMCCASRFDPDYYDFHYSHGDYLWFRPYLS
jgi:hypothetical protein